MNKVKEITVEENADSSIVVLGGNSAKISAWPLNPDGEKLVLVATIDCKSLAASVNYRCVPKNGFIYVFSTYSKSDYFLENITYSGDPSELDSILEGYTAVVLSSAECSTEKSGAVESIPRVGTSLVDKEVSDDEFPVFSMLSDKVPNGTNLPDDIMAEYDFFMQLYSSDFPEPFQDIFYLTDAVGCLLLKKDGTGDGIFFIHTA
ncbi:DUF1963 domain-containing protein [Pseudomonas sp. 20GA0080]|uniref:DUF1963 domain-containing protein n=1 Tax=Pseudomonas alliivorans TaxID=2810613 RepID=UPI001AE25B35|nr:DUF1963 domain-containing protein [Pseudomonas alliivorans]MBP0953985.1 DUF1963 domain-containing protein [Pseudomonas alliivorans]MEE5041682.1 DUF1963 domain-containing protein [Pseudomonas alliivorans]